MPPVDFSFVRDGIAYVEEQLQALAQEPVAPPANKKNRPTTEQATDEPDLDELMP